MSEPLNERARRWRLLLGGGEADGIGGDGLQGDDAAIDRTLAALYDPDSGMGSGSGKTRQAGGQRGGLGSSAPFVARWLGDIRTYFPSSVVQILQRDAIERLDLQRLLLEPEMLQAVEPDVHLVATLVALKDVIPAKTRATAREVVRKVVEDLMRRLQGPMQQAVRGSLQKSVRNRRPRHNEIDWERTIRANLRHYQPAYRTVIPETRIGFGRKRSALQDVVLCIDQSGSMASSVVYSSIFGAVLASMPALRTRLVVFDTAVVDLTDKLSDPVELLFGTQLGGGTDIAQAVTYCRSLMTRPSDTIFVLVSDLFEGGSEPELLRQTRSLMSAGVRCVALLALSDDGRPAYDPNVAGKLATIGVPSFACTPDQFPELMSAALQRRNLAEWAASRGIPTSRASVEDFEQ